MKDEIEAKLAELREEVKAMVETDPRYGAMMAHISACLRLLKEIQ